jgi:hypothetical protein
MLLSIDSTLRDDLVLAHSGGDEALGTLCNAALRVVRQRSARDEVTAGVAAGELSALWFSLLSPPPQELKIALEPTLRMVDAVAFLMGDAARLRATEADFRDSLAALQFRPSAVEMMTSLYWGGNYPSSIVLID